MSERIDKLKEAWALAKMEAGVVRWLAECPLPSDNASDRIYEITNEIMEARQDQITELVATFGDDAALLDSIRHFTEEGELPMVGDMELTEDEFWQWVANQIAEWTAEAM